MNEFLNRQNPEQLMLGGLLAILEDYELDFGIGFFDDKDLDDMMGDIVGALYIEGEDGHEILKEYGAIEDYEV